LSSLSCEKHIYSAVISKGTGYILHWIIIEDEFGFLILGVLEGSCR
jgi:hypothetical protein